ncbi:hypothetical protein K437DRAFT_238501 [Tilletiaria anomala UBC 951]|uniref:DNA polymerase n=1 Tax=Tilletiaria anomala (strain ATCC 24038 / CBS 436.72 / UBC 951) TaxID=1037660 RepID=A0A066VI20_TILAU|nr:uncharacterized protein K437DRAFT_238501 [Tilletiaria anomala UBC 951]KDN41161.1 hypothetical protein K437DRAFT_238501 [Tilletiaria anomala UBC 951]
MASHWADVIAPCRVRSSNTLPRSGGSPLPTESFDMKRDESIVKAGDWFIRPDTPPMDGENDGEHPMALSNSPPHLHVRDKPIRDKPQGKQPLDQQGSRSSGARSGSDGSEGNEEPFFRVRLINIDHAMTEAGPFDRTETAFSPSPLARVPVLRVFGATPAGQRVCMHVHGFFPYTYVEYKGALQPEHVLSYISRLGQELNAAIAASLRRNPYNERCKYINAIHLVKGIPFYGYHVGYSYFLKISFTDPSLNARIHTILETGRVMKTRFQAFEIHVRYQLQWMLDYNIYGCGFVDVEECYFRAPLPESDPFLSKPSSNDVQQRQLWTHSNTPANLVQDDYVSKNSHCELEVDIRVSAILNRRSLCARDIHHRVGERDTLSLSVGGKDGCAQKLVPSLVGLWEEEQRRRLSRGLSASIPPPKSVEGGRALKDGEHPRWQAEDRLWQFVHARIKDERRALGGVHEPRNGATKVEDKANPNSHSSGEKEGIFLNEDEMVKREEAILKERLKERLTAPHALEKYIVSAFDSVDVMHEDHRRTRKVAQIINDPYNPFSSQFSMTAAVESTASSGEHGSSKKRNTHAASGGAGAGVAGNAGTGSSKLKSPRRTAKSSSPPLFDREHQQQPVATNSSGGSNSTTTGPKAGLASTPAILCLGDTANNESSNEVHLADEDRSSHAAVPQMQSQEDLDFFQSQEFQARLRQVELQAHHAEGSDAGDESEGEKEVDALADELAASPVQGTPNGAKRKATSNPSTPNKRFHATNRRAAAALTPPSAAFAAKDSSTKFLVTLTKRHAPETPAHGFAPTKSSSLGMEGAEASDLGRSSEHSLQVTRIANRRKGVNQSLVPETPTIHLRRNRQHVAFVELPDTNASKHPTVATAPATPASRVSSSVPNSSYTKADSSSRASHTAETGATFFQFAYVAPSKDEVMNTFADFNLPREDHAAPFFSNPADVPDRPREYAGRSFTFKSITLPFLDDFEHCSRDERVGNGNDHAAAHSETVGGRISRKHCFCAWEYLHSAPSRVETFAWVRRERAIAAQSQRRRRKRLLSQIEKMTQQQAEATYNFKFSHHQPTSLVHRGKQHMTVFALEAHACSRKELLPNPEVDPIGVIAYSFQNEDETLEDTGSRPGLRTGVIVVARDETAMGRVALSCEVHVVATEEDAFVTLITLVRKFDPEILVGYEIHNESWGYIIERAHKAYDLDMVLELGRVKESSTGITKGKLDNWGYTQTSALRITGRHVLNIWRLMRGEVALTQYTYENIVYHLLHRRVPKFSSATLTAWWRAVKTPELLRRVIAVMVSRAETDLEILEASELVMRTAEFSKIYGVDFFSVLSRGSQFKVESVMFRIAKPESFILPSPSTIQVASQNAAECIPLIMEPQSAFFKGPLIVLDFQSLYPSVMIAYNICYSTCLGRVADFKGVQKFGFSELNPPRGLLTLLKDDITISPNGLIYVKPHVRRSLLAKMLSEILETRVMIKGSTKGVKDDKVFLRLQNARQLSLKLLANVTYGYTSASFSGRMPCVEIADSIVQYGRETLEKAIQIIDNEPKWGAKVVYGDTDSVFIYLEGRTKDDAFKIGNDIANKVTAQNPKPVKLKFEKVYLPSILLAKKRYVGYKFEHPDEDIPTFDAKGIETVRRDGNAALQRIQEACIRILFRTRDLSQVKFFLLRQWQKILEGRVNLQDFVIAKEVRIGSYSDKVPPPPGVAVATRKMMLDPRAEPQYAERVPYIISQGEPKAKLNDQAVSPEVMLQNPGLHLNGIYYIERSIMQPLARIFNLLGADVERWFKEMPRVRPIYQGRLQLDLADAGHKVQRLTLAEHYRVEHCLICGETTDKVLCLDCRLAPQASTLRVTSRLHVAQQRQLAMSRICASCSSFPHPEDSPCVSLDCPMLFAKVKGGLEVENTHALLRHLDNAFDDSSNQTANSWISLGKF